MAFQAGTGNTAQDFLDALRGFALAQGWTVRRWDTANRRFYLEKGVCRVAMEWVVSNAITDFTSGSGVARQNHFVRGTLCSAIVDTNLNWWTMAGVPTGMTAQTDARAVHVADLTGPFVQWFFFSDVGGNYIHAVINTVADRYTHMIFGNVDQGDLTHGGAAYFHGTSHYWWATNVAVGSANFNKPSLANMFGSLAGSNLPHSHSQVYVKNALPVTFTNDIATSSNNGTTNTPIDVAVLGTHDAPVNLGGSQVSDHSALLNHLVIAETLGWSAAAMLFAVPKIVSNPARNQVCCVGFIPDLRLLNMTGLLSQQEITIGADVWKVFPFLRQAPWSHSGTVMAPTSGQYAIAYKKIV